MLLVIQILRRMNIMKKLIVNLSLMLFITYLFAFDYDLGILSVSTSGYGYQNDSAVFLICKFLSSAADLYALG